jgi:hypothetical protein
MSLRPSCRTSVRPALLFLAFTLPAGPAFAGPVTLVSATTYANFHAAGVVVTVSGDTERNASAALQWRAAGEIDFRPGHPLTRVDATRFAGSLFWLEPGNAYEVRVTLSDPDGLGGPAVATRALTTRPAALPEPSLRTLHVSPTGSDTNPGTSAGAPLRTIQRAASLAQAGDLVLIQPGVYRESVSVPRSGTAAQPIVFRGTAPGVVLDGADAALAAGGSWTSQGNGVYSRAAGFSTGNVVAGDGRLFRYASLAALQALAAGEPGGFFSSGTTLYLKLADGSSPSAHAIHAARREEGLVLDGRSHVRIENLEVRHYGAGDFGKGVYLRLATDCAVRNSRIHHIGSAGIWMKGGERNLIENNEVWDTSIFGWPWDLVKGSPAETSAIYQTDAPGRGNVIRGNTVHGSFNGIVPCGSGAPAGGVLTNEMDVYDNALRRHLDDAFEPEGYCSNLRLWGNRVEDVHMAFAVAPAGPGPLYLVRNVVHRHGNTRASQVDGYTSSVLKIHSGSSTPVGPLFLYHNTVLTDAPATDAVALFSGGSATAIRARNNVFAATRYALSKSHSVPLDWNGDDLYSTSTSRLVRWLSASYATLPLFRAATGQEAQGIQAAPQLEDPDGGDFRPAPGSPLIDRGLVVAGINDGFVGAAPDIGALEREDSAPLPSLSVSDVTVTEGNAGTVGAIFAITLSAPSPQTVTVRFVTEPLTATEGVDYVRAASLLTFPPGTTRRTVVVTVVGDALREADEDFWLNLEAPIGAQLGDGQGRGRIRNDDAPPRMAISDASVLEGNVGTVTATFTVSLSAASGQPVTVSYVSANQTALAGSDYTSVSGSLTFAPGTTRRTIAVSLLGDVQREADETFLVNLFIPGGAILADGQGVGSIRNDDP